MSSPRKGVLQLVAGTALALSAGCLEEGRLRPVPNSGDREPLEITVTAPNGGEIWRVGDTCAITWLTQGIGPAVDIALLRAGRVCVVIADSAPNSGSFDWICTRCGRDSLGYQIRVSDAASTWLDVSDGPFVVTLLDEVCALEVTEPHRDRVWVEGQVMHIAWDGYGGACGDVARIELIRNGTVCAGVAAATANDGAFDWVVAPCSGDSTGYRIRIIDVASGAWDESDCTLTLLAAPPAPCSLTVLAPDGGEQWVEHRSYAIRWESSADCGPTVDIELIHAAQSLRTVVAAGVPNSGSHVWTAQRLAEATQGYVVRIVDPSSGAADESDGAFSILAPGEPCLPAVVSPNGGEVWAAGEPYRITWDREGACGSYVSISLLQGGVPCKTIVSGTPSSGSFLWVAAPCGAQSSGYTVRVVDLSSGAADESDAPFSIRQPCEITVTAPASGVTLAEGEATTIRWLQAGECQGPVSIELVQSGEVCASIAAGVSNTGSYTWTVTRCGAATAGYRVRITDLDTGRAAHSPGTFAIEGPCLLRLHAPNGGEAWVDGRVETIHWLRTGACAETVVIDLLRDGSPCARLADAAPNTGSFDWRAHQVSGHEAGYQIRISDPGGAAGDQSYGPFSILPPCRLELLGPDGGETLVSGRGEYVVWDASATCGRQVRIDLLRGTSLCRTIAPTAENDGSHDWTPQPCDGETEGYRIVVTDLTSLAADTSAAAFTIRTPILLRFSAEAGGWSMRTNNPDWVGKVDLIFDADATHRFGSAEWLPGGEALILDPDGDRAASFFPALTTGAAARQGLLLSPLCNGVDVRLTGQAQETSTQLGLAVSTNGSADCRSALPAVAELRTMSAGFTGGCLSAAGALRIVVTFTDQHTWNRTYAVREVEYVFNGWPAP